jgi:hypothetical protein
MGGGALSGGVRHVRRVSQRDQNRQEHDGTKQIGRLSRASKEEHGGACVGCCVL